MNMNRMHVHLASACCYVCVVPQIPQQQERKVANTVFVLTFGKERQNLSKLKEKYILSISRQRRDVSDRAGVLGLQDHYSTRTPHESTA